MQRRGAQRRGLSHGDRGQHMSLPVRSTGSMCVWHLLLDSLRLVSATFAPMMSLLLAVLLVTLGVDCVLRWLPPFADQPLRFAGATTVRYEGTVYDGLTAQQVRDGGATMSVRVSQPVFPNNLTELRAILMDVSLSSLRVLTDTGQPLTALPAHAGRSSSDDVHMGESDAAGRELVRKISEKSDAECHDALLHDSCASLLPSLYAAMQPMMERSAIEVYDGGRAVSIVFASMPYIIPAHQVILVYPCLPLYMLERHPGGAGQGGNHSGCLAGPPFLVSSAAFVKLDTTRLAAMNEFTSPFVTGQPVALPLRGRDVHRLSPLDLERRLRVVEGTSCTHARPALVFSGMWSTHDESYRFTPHRGGLQTLCYSPFPDTVPPLLQRVTTTPYEVAGPEGLSTDPPRLHRGVEFVGTIYGTGLTERDSAVITDELCSDFSTQRVQFVELLLSGSARANFYTTLMHNGTFHLCYRHALSPMYVHVSTLIVEQGKEMTLDKDNTHVLADEYVQLSPTTEITRLRVQGKGGLDLKHRSLNLTYFVWSGNSITGKGSIYCTGFSKIITEGLETRRLSVPLYNYGEMTIDVQRLVLDRDGIIHNYGNLTLSVPSMGGDVISSVASAERQNRIINHDGGTIRLVTLDSRSHALVTGHLFISGGTAIMSGRFVFTSLTLSAEGRLVLSNTTRVGVRHARLGGVVQLSRGSTLMVREASHMTGPLLRGTGTCLIAGDDIILDSVRIQDGVTVRFANGERDVSAIVVRGASYFGPNTYTSVSRVNFVGFASKPGELHFAGAIVAEYGSTYISRLVRIVIESASVLYGEGQLFEATSMPSMSPHRLLNMAAVWSLAPGAVHYVVNLHPSLLEQAGSEATRKSDAVADAEKSGTAAGTQDGVVDIAATAVRDERGDETSLANDTPLDLRSFNNSCRSPLVLSAFDKLAGRLVIYGCVVISGGATAVNGSIEGLTARADWERLQGLLCRNNTLAARLHLCRPPAPRLDRLVPHHHPNRDISNRGHDGEDEDDDDVEERGEDKRSTAVEQDAVPQRATGDDAPQALTSLDDGVHGTYTAKLIIVNTLHLVQGATFHGLDEVSLLAGLVWMHDPLELRAERRLYIAPRTRVIVVHGGTLCAPRVDIQGEVQLDYPNASVLQGSVTIGPHGSVVLAEVSAPCRAHLRVQGGPLTLQRAEREAVVCTATSSTASEALPPSPSSSSPVTSPSSSSSPPSSQPGAAGDGVMQDNSATSSVTGNEEGYPRPHHHTYPYTHSMMIARRRERVLAHLPPGISCPSWLTQKMNYEYDSFLQYWGVQEYEMLPNVPTTRDTLLMIVAAFVFAFTVFYSLLRVWGLTLRGWYIDLRAEPPLTLTLTWSELCCNAMNHIIFAGLLLLHIQSVMGSLHPALPLPMPFTAMLSFRGVHMSMPHLYNRVSSTRFVSIAMVGWGYLTFILFWRRVRSVHDRNRTVMQFISAELLAKASMFIAVVFTTFHVPLFYLIIDGITCPTLLRELPSCQPYRSVSTFVLSFIALCTVGFVLPLSTATFVTPLTMVDLRPKVTWTFTAFPLEMLEMLLWKTLYRLPVAAIIITFLFQSLRLFIRWTTATTAYRNVNTFLFYAGVAPVFVYACLILQVVRVKLGWMRSCEEGDNWFKVALALVVLSFIVNLCVNIFYVRAPRASVGNAYIDTARRSVEQIRARIHDLKLDVLACNNATDRENMLNALSRLRIEFLEKRELCHYETYRMLRPFFFGKTFHSVNLFINDTSYYPQNEDSPPGMISPLPVSRGLGDEDDANALDAVGTLAQTGQLTTEEMESFSCGPALGKGSYGTVHLGILPSGRLVAVKYVSIASGNEDVLHTVMAEVNMLRELSHPNIIRYYGAYTTADVMLVFMEFAVGGSLTSLVRKFTTLSESVLQLYTYQILCGLQYLHGKGVVHRDIKGENILIDGYGVVKLADFGCSKSLANIANASHGGCGTLVGSPFWMAPEVIRSEAYGTKADIWSVGCTVVEMLNGGEPPWRQEFDNVYSAMFHVGSTNSIPQIPEKTSELCRDFLSKCFVRDAAQRATAEELLQHPWLAGVASSAMRNLMLDESAAYANTVSPLLTNSPNSMGGFGGGSHHEHASLNGRGRPPLSPSLMSPQLPPRQHDGVEAGDKATNGDGETAVMMNGLTSPATGTRPRRAGSSLTSISGVAVSPQTLSSPTRHCSLNSDSHCIKTPTSPLDRLMSVTFCSQVLSSRADAAATKADGEGDAPQTPLQESESSDKLTKKLQ